MAVSYASAFLVSYNTSPIQIPWTLGRIFPFGLIVGLILAPILVPALAALTRTLGGPIMKVAWSYLAACGVFVVAFLLIEALDRPQAPWWRLRSLAFAALRDYWTAFFTLTWLAILSWIHRPARRHVDSLAGIAVLVWGLASTFNHFQTFYWHHQPRMIWFVAIESAIALMLVLISTVLFQQLAAKPPLPRSFRTALLITIVAVLFDWGFTLYATTSFQALQSQESRDEPPPVESCEPAVLSLPSQVVGNERFRASFRPLLVGCDDTIRCLSQKQQQEISSFLAEVVLHDPRTEFERRHSPERWLTLAAQVEEKLGCAVASHVLLGDFALEDLTASEPLRVGGDVLAPLRLAGDSSDLEPLLSEYDQAVCIVQTVVSREGLLEQVELLRPEDCAPEPRAVLLGMFDSWRFEPATLRGEPVSVFYHLTIHHCPCLDRG